VNERTDLFGGKFPTVAFFGDDLLWTHKLVQGLVFQVQRSGYYTRCKSTTASARTARRSPTASTPSPVFAFTLTQLVVASRVSATPVRILSMYGRSFGDSRWTVESTFTIS